MQRQNIVIKGLLNGGRLTDQARLIKSNKTHIEFDLSCCIYSSFSWDFGVREHKFLHQMQECSSGGEVGREVCDLPLNLLVFLEDHATAPESPSG